MEAKVWYELSEMQDIFVELKDAIANDPRAQRQYIDLIDYSARYMMSKLKVRTKSGKPYTDKMTDEEADKWRDSNEAKTAMLGVASSIMSLNHTIQMHNLKAPKFLEFSSADELNFSVCSFLAFAEAETTRDMISFE